VDTPDPEDGGEKPVLQSTADIRGLSIDPSGLRLPKLSPEELLGLTFIKEADGQKFRARVVRKINDDDAAEHQKIKFLVERGDGNLDEIMAYAELYDLIESRERKNPLTPIVPGSTRTSLGMKDPSLPQTPNTKDVSTMS
jgi:hypothetical protein